MGTLNGRECFESPTINAVVAPNACANVGSRADLVLRQLGHCSYDPGIGSATFASMPFAWAVRPFAVPQRFPLGTMSVIRHMDRARSRPAVFNNVQTPFPGQATVARAGGPGA